MSSPTSPEEIRRLVNELYAAWSLHEPHRIDAIFTDDAIYSDIAGGKNQQGKQQIKQLLRAAFEWAPDFRVTLLSLNVGTDAAATEWVSEGIQTGPIGDLPAVATAFACGALQSSHFEMARFQR
jgi:uncharacterized protein (TIGR02246 family)